MVAADSAPPLPEAALATRLPDPRAVAALGRILASSGPRVAVVGASKNAGKTTTLNALLAATAAQGLCAGLVSIGRDGEAFDAWLDFAKPRVRVEKGTLVVTAASVAAQSGRLLEPLMTLAFSSSLGPNCLARARSPGGVELCGVPHRRALVEAVADLRAWGAQRVLIDGAYHRQAPVHPHVSDAVVAAVGAVLGANPAEAALAAWPTLWALSRPAWRGGPSPLGDPAPGGPGPERHALHWQGGVTEGYLPDILDQLSQLPRSSSGELALVAADPSRLLLSARGIAQLEARGITTFVAHAVPLAAVTTNPFRPGDSEPSAAWLDAVAALMNHRGLGHIPLLDVVSGEQRAPGSLPRGAAALDG